jgi:hypothetical protein
VAGGLDADTLNGQDDDLLNGGGVSSFTAADVFL